VQDFLDNTADTRSEFYIKASFKET